MSIPKLPLNLTLQEWNTNKARSFPTADLTDLEARLKKFKVNFLLVRWALLDLDRVKPASLNPEQARRAVEAAKDDFQRVTRLQAEVQALRVDALAAKAGLVNAKIMPGAEYLVKVAVAAGLLEMQLRNFLKAFTTFEKTTRAPKPEPVLPKPPARPASLLGRKIISERWFNDLAAITVYKDPEVLRWATDRLVAAGGARTPRPLMLQKQAQLRKTLIQIQRGVEKLRALQAKRMELLTVDKVEDILKRMIKPAIHDLHPDRVLAGQSYVKLWAQPENPRSAAAVIVPTAIMKRLVKSTLAGTFDLTTAQPDIAKLNKKVARTLQDQAIMLEALANHLSLS